jgi:nucleotide-binding universal stress UspA family protein
MTEPRKVLNLKRLLVATDLSSRADKAIARAVQLAEGCAANEVIANLRDRYGVLWAACTAPACTLPSLR